MKKKYPGKTIESIKANVMAEGLCLSSLEIQYVLDAADAAGMLKEIPDPLEIEYCTKHSSVCQWAKERACQYVVTRNNPDDGDCKYI